MKCYTCVDIVYVDAIKVQYACNYTVVTTEKIEFPISGNVYYMYTISDRAKLKVNKVLDNELAVHSQRQRRRCHEQRWLPALESSALLLTASYLECASTPETSEKLRDSVLYLCTARS